MTDRISDEDLASLERAALVWAPVDELAAQVVSLIIELKELREASRTPRFVRHPYARTATLVEDGKS